MNGSVAFYHANVVPMENGARHSGVFINHGEIAAVGSDDEIFTACARAGIKPLDAKGATILPGFYDCHCHVLMTGQNLSGLDLYNIGNIPNLIAALKEQDAQLQPGQWLYAKRLDESRLEEKRPPVMSELDCIQRPVYLADRGGHYKVVNRLAFEALNIKPDMRGVRRGPDGNPNGRLQDDANFQAANHFPWSEKQKREAVLAGLNLAASKGITTIHDVEGIGENTDTEVRLVAETAREFPINHILWWATTKVDKIKSAGLKNWGADIMLDGSIGSRTAAFSENYSDGDTAGSLYYKPEYVAALVNTAVKNDICISFHCIGELGIRLALDAIESAWKANPDKRDMAKFRLDHFGFPSQTDIERAAKYHVAISTQPAFTFLRGGVDSVYRSRLGEKRERTGYPLRRLMDAGLIIGGGSDSDATPLDPLLGIHSAVNPPYPENALTPFEAVRIYTVDAAKMTGDFDRKGSIRVGKQGDLVLLSENPLTVDHKQIRDIKVLMTVYNGVVSYQVPEPTC